MIAVVGPAFSLLLLLSPALLVPPALGAQTFGTSLKGIRLHHQVEQSVYTRTCAAAEAPCALQHWWSGGTFAGYAATRVRYYVDGAPSGPVDMPLGLAHGQGDETEDNGPWSAGTLFGKSGVGLHGVPSSGSGFFNTWQVPFGSSINVTVELGGGTKGAGDYFWLVLRGRTQATVQLPGGHLLPPTARLRSFETRATSVAAYEEVPLFNSTAANGAVLGVMLNVASPGGHFGFLEGMLRAYTNVTGGTGSSSSSSSSSSKDDGDAASGAATTSSSSTSSSSSSSSSPFLLSSGTEDYFLGTFYFDKGQYFLPLAGVTMLCPQPHDGASREPSIGCTPAADGSVKFSAYRLHPTADPLLFEHGMAATWRNGEPGHGGGSVPVNATTFVLMYEW